MERLGFAASSWKRVYFHLHKHLMRQDRWSVNFNFIDLINVCCMGCPGVLSVYVVGGQWLVVVEKIRTTK